VRTWYLTLSYLVGTFHTFLLEYRIYNSARIKTIPFKDGASLNNM
jgi:hypothetical protein